MRVFSSHEVVTIDSLRTAFTKGAVDCPVLTHEDIKCSVHQEEALSVYCLECQILVCRICLLNSHKNHNYIKVADGASQHLLQFKNQADLVNKRLDGLRLVAKSFKAPKKTLTDRGTAVMKEIDDAFDDMSSKLMKKKEELKKKASDIISKANDNITTQEEKITQAEEEMQRLLVSLNREGYTDQEMLSLEKHLCSAVDKVSQNYSNPAEKFPVPMLHVPQLKLQPFTDEVIQVIDDRMSVTSEGNN